MKNPRILLVVRCCWPARSVELYLVGTDFPLEQMLAFGGITDLNPRTAAGMIVERLSNAQKIGKAGI